MPSWVRKYGNGSWGKRIRVETPEEINHTKQLKRRVRLLEQALADANIDLALERQYTRLACRRAGIEDVEGLKKSGWEAAHGAVEQDGELPGVNVSLACAASWG